MLSACSAVSWHQFLVDLPADDKPSAGEETHFKYPQKAGYAAWHTELNVIQPSFHRGQANYAPGLLSDEHRDYTTKSHAYLANNKSYIKGDSGCSVKVLSKNCQENLQVQPSEYRLTPVIFRKYSVERGWFIPPIDPARDIQTKKDYSNRIRGIHTPYRIK
jgi:hypothetical protein